MNAPNNTIDAMAAFSPAPCSASFRGASCLNADCMDVMAKLADKAYDLAICDPPYGIGNRIAQGTNPNHLATRGKASLLYKNNPFDHAPPAPEYFAELRRVSRHQIIWGGNYFPLPPHRCFIFWDKVNYLPTMSDGEMAWTSFDKPARKIKICKAGSEPIIHPTQKPVRLYAWLLQEYAQPGWKILDTHMGSGSSVIAAVQEGFEMLACEIDAEYFASAVERIGRDLQQQTFAMTRNNALSEQEADDGSAERGTE
jgi:site-specific DNA-methyltransferase (adenine-specific)